ncbi:MAG: nicotinamide-nucleotide amidase [Clostridiales bacterium]|jgi:nicotinamide-nucleotide amidase|nr:nicotinamide-nucleotide amidase [Clostridiales bacterium]
MKAELIFVGTELLLGDILNTNAQYLSKELAALGIVVHSQSVVGDNAARLATLVAQAKERSDLLVFTGGLGPTGDDLTKETVAQVFGDELVLDERELDKIKMYFECRGGMPHNNEKQAMVPKHGEKIENTCGTAPGAVFHQNGKTAILMPGPPREMRAMFEHSVRGILQQMAGGAIVSTMLHIFGTGESALEEMVPDLIDGENPTGALYAKEGEVAVRVTARADTTQQAEALRDTLVQKFRDRLGDLIYSEQEDGTLEGTVVSQLTARRQRVATAESCTGGLLAQRITAVPGASEVFDFGAVTYAAAAKRHILGVKPASIKKYSVYSSVVAAEMAFGVQKAGRADYGVGITGIAGPDGGSVQKPVGTVYVAVALGHKVWVKRLAVEHSARQRVRRMATQTALDMLRRLTQGLPLPDTRCFGRHDVQDF